MPLYIIKKIEEQIYKKQLRMWNNSLKLCTVIQTWLYIAKKSPKILPVDLWGENNQYLLAITVKHTMEHIHPTLIKHLQ